MIVKQLISLLENLPEDADVVFRPTNCDYVYSFSFDEPTYNDIRTFWGSDRKAFVIKADDQVGADWGESVDL